jgi:hypothetical protein
LGLALGFVLGLLLVFLDLVDFLVVRGLDTIGHLFGFYRCTGLSKVL